MLDFTNCVEIINSYKGSEKKKTLLIDEQKYLVKFPDPIREKDKSLSYINNTFSEYIGSHVFEILEFDVQQTLLGTYIYQGKKKIVCACRDFTDASHTLCDFENLALSFNPNKKIGTELTDIMEIIDASKNIINSKETKEMFWQIFVVDAFIGNVDRHNGNWGFLLSKDGTTHFAPIYDCGSCLNPILSDEDIFALDEKKIKNLAINTHSCFKENGKRINPLSYIISKKNDECTKAFETVFPKIKDNMKNIIAFIEAIDCLSNSRKEFYIKVLNMRYELLEKHYYKLIMTTDNKD